MSIESAKAFFMRVTHDEDFRKSVGEIATVEQRIEYVKAAGFEFSNQDLYNAIYDINARYPGRYMTEKGLKDRGIVF